ncbi:MAG: hypothetical protein LBC62_02140 [Treponema sp.]|jgi:phosphoribosyl 1,2-cyclic phosphate phosphodiesterase|nr:hypothetical protein [Treponema sp.]
MKLQYLGTGAAEGIPAIFCSCAVCEEARKKRGKNIRTRSQALVDGVMLLDFPPDTYAHYLAYDFYFPGIRHVLVTHSHMDHFSPAEFELRRPDFITSPLDTLNIYGNSAVEAALMKHIENGPSAPYLRFTRACPFEPLDLSGYTVIPFPALHDRSEECLFYAVTHEGKALLYAHDTGIFPEPVWDYIAKTGLRFNLVSLDCTVMIEKDGTNHMGIPDNVEVRSRLVSLGAADKNTVFIVNHFSHNGGLNHDLLSQEAAKEGFIAAYDGLETVL